MLIRSIFELKSHFTYKSFTIVWRSALFSGIFAYLNYLTPKTRKEVLDLLVNGLKRLEYRGYDSAGLAIDSNDGRDIVLVKRTGKVQFLQDAITDGRLHIFNLLTLLYRRERKCFHLTWIVLWSILVVVVVLHFESKSLWDG